MVLCKFFWRKLPKDYSKQVAIYPIDKKSMIIMYVIKYF